MAVPYETLVKKAKNGEITGLEKATIKQFSATDAEILDSDLSRTVSERKEDFVAELIRKNRHYVRLLAEAVNDNSKQGYGGLTGDGSELTTLWITPQTFGKTTWNRSTVASGVQDFIASTTLGEEEGIIIFGWMDRVMKPPVDAIKAHKGTEQTTIEPLAFNAVERIGTEDPDGTFAGGSVETPIVEMRKPLIVPPQTDFRIEEKKPVSGLDDGLQPLGFHVVRAEDAWDLTAYPEAGGL